MSTGTPTPQRPANASMALLNQVMDRPLDPAYAAAAERRRARGQTPGQSGRSPLTLVVVLLVGLLLATAALQARGQLTSRVATRDQLVAEITRQDKAAAGLQRSNVDLQARIEAERARQLVQQSQAGLADEVSRLGLVTGALAVTGPGVTLTVDDAPSTQGVAGNDPRASTTADDGRVLDQDLQVAVNGLWAAGAEAVSINGQRLTALSAIRSAGQAILVDYRPLSPPYTITAIGDPDTLPARFGAGAGGRDLQYLADNFGVRYSVTPSQRLTLPASAGLDVRRAQPVTSATSSPTTRTSSPSATTSRKQEHP